MTNRESGPSALATALTDGLQDGASISEKNRVPNILVHVDCEMGDMTDWSILGDWIGQTDSARMETSRVPCQESLDSQTPHSI